ncbi:FkbM family methyltransferase [Maritimibacter dapengensis]|uniref:FkbM family methyltransferase n=1 Tax=Maritimibacter dapengensis TaxID=2836868 RepID=A0ABS6T2J0_9RHOB|nr:FkbM family methyltransferase [Maritimibacter dapengensis]MBV7379459.1 FkbM family methyltransferase [Maritimibacter dapengensis]
MFRTKTKRDSGKTSGDGTRAKIVHPSEYGSNANTAILRRNRKFTYRDQKGQVDFLVNNVLDYEKNGLPKNGYFVDLACADGVYISNTYFLEKHLNWTGLLFEPNPEFHDKIRAARRSPLVTDCVTDTAGETVKFRIDNGMLGGIVSNETDNNAKIRGEELADATVVDIPTTTLEKELDAAGAPSVIDFLSLDIEGAEWIALRSFPFEKYSFRCMTIENPTIELDLLLDEKGYRQVAHLRQDVIYVQETELPNVNFAPNTVFAFTPKKRD